MDVYATSPPILNASLGVRFHLAGTPARMFAQPDGGNRSGALASAALPTADAEREWWKPRLSLGTGVETHYLPGENGTYSGFLTVFPAALRFPFGGEVVFQASMPLGWTGIVGERGAYEISDYEFKESDQGEYIDPFYATPRLNRVTSVEAGYRLRRDEWLSLRPAVRYTWADLELWDIAANIFYDGSERELKAGEEHFARADPARWLGPSFELTLQLGRRFTLRAVGAALLPITRGETRVKPVLAPEVLVEYPGTLYSGSLSITAGL